MPAMLMKHDDDPRTQIWKDLGDLSDFHVYNNQCLVRVYERPEKTKSGILLTRQTRDEDKHQGKAALIIKIGPSAFDPDNDQGWWSGERNPHIGDWIAVRPSDGWPITINGQLCRMLTDTAVRMLIPAPDAVW